MKNKILNYLTPALFLILIAVVALILNSRWNRQIASYEEVLEVNRKELNELRSSQELLKQNTIQVRQYMNLPPIRFEDEENKSSESTESGNFELAAYDAVAFLQTYTQSQNKLKLYNEKLESPVFLSLLENHKLVYTGTSPFNGVLRKNGNQYFLVEYSTDDDRFLFTASLDRNVLSGDLNAEEVGDFISAETGKMDALYELSAKRNNEILLLYRDSTLKKSLADLELWFSDSGMSGISRYIPIVRIDGSELTRVSTDTATGEFLLDQKKFKDLETLRTGILDYVSKQDIRTASRIVDDSIEEELLALLKDTAFNARLNDLEFHPVLEPREDNDYIYYDFLDGGSVRKGSLALQKDFGELYLMDGDDIPIRSLKTFSGSHDIVFNFQTEASSGGSDSQDMFVPAQGSETFLLIGSHEHNADTMILLHCDSGSSEIRMLSIPRDLYYEGRKINSIYREYGSQRLASELSALTGLSITKYVAIDMYAFIDVVNILGGIDVTLDETLVDPTYKVKVNGSWSTLYYTAGTHHLDGIAALRIARSRHTSSDFERSVRQQKVIGSLKDKAGSMGLSDMNKIYDLIQTTGKYVDTNLSTAEMVKYFLSYKDYAMAGQNVMNTDNILYATYTNLYRLTEEEQKTALEDPGFYKGGWIVLPKGNDWSIIKSYIRSVLTRT